MSNRRSRLFIGASLEGLPVARELKRGLAEEADCTLWTQGAFTLEKLCQASPAIEYAILVLGSADLSSEAAAGRNRPRDSVLFQIGLFAGLLGRSRMLLVHSRDIPLDLPPDLAGLRTATFSDAGNLESALAPVLSLLRGGLEGRTARLSRLSRPKDTASASPPKRAEASPKDGGLDARALIERAFEAEDKPGESIDPDLVEGLWRDETDDTSLVVRMIGGEMRAPYAFRGATRLTGEFFGWKLHEGVLSGHFRWVQQGIEGRIVLRMIGLDRLEGVWFFGWADREIPLEILSRAAHPIRLVRQRAPRALPPWSEEFFRAAELVANVKH